LSHQSLIDAVARYYTNKVTEYGPTPKGVDWRDAESQALRFQALIELIPDDGLEVSINDYGCGYGALFDVLAERWEEFQYLGYDVSEAMIAQARARHSADQRASFTTDVDELRQADYTVASGIFNVRLNQPLAQWRTYVLETLDKLAMVSRRGFVFNALTAHADPGHVRGDLYYADPAELLDHCLRHYSRDVALRHDYPLYEFTVSVRLGGRAPVRVPERSAHE
jgi:SAM-dependent methyltransferase